MIHLEVNYKEHPIYENVTSITYWDDGRDSKEVYDSIKKRLTEEIPN